MLIKAFFIALQAHKGQKDKAGRAYIFHPVKVALLSKGKKQKTVALLHDVVEDTEITLEDLKNKGFNDEIVEAVRSITKIHGESYGEYLKRVKNNNIARYVKIADLTHNCDLSRLKCITPKDFERTLKYQIALYYLCS